MLHVLNHSKTPLSNTKGFELKACNTNMLSKGSFTLRFRTGSKLQYSNILFVTGGCAEASQLGELRTPITPKEGYVNGQVPNFTHKALFPSYPEYYPSLETVFNPVHPVLFSASANASASQW